MPLFKTTTASFAPKVVPSLALFSSASARVIDASERASDSTRCLALRSIALGERSTLAGERRARFYSKKDARKLHENAEIEWGAAKEELSLRVGNVKESSSAQLVNR